MQRKIFEDCTLGCEISRVIADAIKQAFEDSCEYEFDFNGVTVVVRGHSQPELILRDWERASRGYLGLKPVVGPFPAPLSEQTRLSDARIESENEQRRLRLQAKYKAEQEKKSLSLQGALSTAPPFDVIDTAGWEKCKANNSNPYGGRIVRYAEEWGRLIQARIDNGEKLEDCAKELSFVADDDGITGFMYGAAVSILAGCWRHGEQLRRWHNRSTQLRDEGDKANEQGGVLNPALLVIDV